MKHPIPIDVFEQHAIALGKTGAGKSYALRGIIEILLKANKRVCIIDPKGDHYGIKLSADGKGPGFPVMAFGSFKNPKASDMTINERSGKEIGELIADGNRPVVIGMRGWMPSQTHQFWVDFASSLFNKITSPLYLIIDEVHNFAPKGKIMSPQVGLSLHWSNRLGSEGRGMGLRLMLASQRPQKVHNDLLTCCETLIAMRVTHPSDRGAFHEWLKQYSDDNERGKRVISSLAEMQKGEAFVWSPEVGFFEKIKFPTIETFDSFASPKEGKQVQLKGWAEVDLGEVKQRLSKLVEEEKAKDPTELKKKIRALEFEIAKKPKQVDEAAISRAMEKARADATREAASTIKSLEATVVRQQSVMKKAAETLVAIAIELPKHEPSYSVGTTTSPASGAVPLVSLSKRFVPLLSRPIVHDPNAIAFVGSLTKAQQAIVNSLAWWRALGFNNVTRAQVAHIAGLKPGAGHFTNQLGSCRTAGLIDYPSAGNVSLTVEGEALVTEFPDHRPTAIDLYDRIRVVLNTAQNKIFEVLWNNPRMTREELGEASRYSAGTGHFTNQLGRLRTLELCEYPEPGTVELAKWIRELQ